MVQGEAGQYSKEHITLDLIHHHFHYDNKTGKFFRLTKSSRAIDNEDGSVKLLKSKTNVGLYLVFARFKVNVLWLAWFYHKEEQPPKGYIVEPINGDYTDARLNNLTLVNRGTKIIKGKSNTEKHKKRKLPTGVIKHGNKFKVQIYSESDNRSIYLGVYDTPEEAAKLYEETRKQLIETGSAYVILKNKSRLITYQNHLPPDTR